MPDFDRLNDGTRNPPRLQIHHSLWSLNKLPMNAPTEWTVDEKFARVKDAGFAGIEIAYSAEKEDEYKAALGRYGLRLTMGHHPHTLDDVRRTVERAVRMGAVLVFAQPLTPYASLPEAVAFMREAVKIGNDAGLPFFIETHRGNIPESLNQALALVEQMPEIRFTGDFSHFVVVGEFYGWEDEQAIERMMPVLERTSHLHGRISSGEQVQVDVGDGTGDTPQFFVRIWEATMRAWLTGAGPGDLFPFASELGPPRYAITLPDGTEFSDWWAQSLVMKQLAEQAWAQAQQG